MLQDHNILISNLSERLKKDNLLKKLLFVFEKEYNLKPRIGVEIEFYLDQTVDFKNFCKYFSYLSQLKNNNFNITKEKGNNQYEIDLSPSNDLINYISLINQVRIAIVNSAIRAGGYAILDSKPYINDYGNSMHFHIDFLGDFDIDFAAKSLCSYMLESFLVFMPKREDYLRIDERFMTPTHVARGYNNRSVAVRIPASYPKRLEHRVASPFCDPYMTIFAILNAIILGIIKPDQIGSHPIIHGNAFDQQYNLIPLPNSIEEAVKLFNYKFFINEIY